MTSDAARDRETHNADRVNRPGELLRLAAMTKTVLDELRRPGFDDADRSRIEALYKASLNELSGVVSDDLRDELDRLVQPLVDAPELTGPELRVAEAQLSGWLDGVIQGLQASAMAQQAAMLRASRPASLHGPRSTES
jgi:hypothetical protein